MAVSVEPFEKFALVDFEKDKSVSVVPFSTIVESDSGVGSVCSVQWNKMVYKATILAIGMYTDLCRRKFITLELCREEK